jgi:hypothetical protein
MRSRSPHAGVNNAYAANSATMELTSSEEVAMRFTLLDWLLTWLLASTFACNDSERATPAPAKSVEPSKPGGGAIAATTTVRINHIQELGVNPQTRPPMEMDVPSTFKLSDVANEHPVLSGPEFRITLVGGDSKKLPSVENTTVDVIFKSQDDDGFALIVADAGGAGDFHIETGRAKLGVTCFADTTSRAQA